MYGMLKTPLERIQSALKKKKEDKNNEKKEEKDDSSGNALEAGDTEGDHSTWIRKARDAFRRKDVHRSKKYSFHPHDHSPKGGLKGGRFRGGGFSGGGKF
jgi:hypothetical protein